MSNFNPNRINAGKSGAGQFTHKVNSEADIDLSDELPEQPSTDASVVPARIPGEEAWEYKNRLYEAAKASSLDFDNMVESNPTIEGYKEALSKHSDMINWTSNGELLSIDEEFEVVGNSKYHLRSKFSEGKKRPKEIGGIRVRMVSGDKDKTVEFRVEAEPGRDADVDELREMVAKKLRIKRDWRSTAVLDSATTFALGEEGASTETSLEYNHSTEALELRHFEVEYLPSRRSEFIEEHEGSAPISDGWL